MSSLTLKFYFQEKDKAALPVARILTIVGILLPATIGQDAAFCQYNNRKNIWATSWPIEMYYLCIWRWFKM